DERLRAAATGEELPDPPRIYADLVSVKIGFGTTFVYEVMLIAVVGILTRSEGTRALVRTFRMNTYQFDDVWRPALAVIVAYAAVLSYALILQALDLDWLEPRSTVPDAVTRDPLALAMAGVLACLVAPFGEELFFRGLVFTGLIRWGFLPAAAISAFVFTLAHIDIGSLIPFFLVGLVMAYLYWWRGNLWDSIIFHFLFNSISFLLLLSRT
ncbi:MAG: lysostaphin resistance A-like protein, partial [Hyphomicrobiales bacterium]